MVKNKRYKIIWDNQALHQLQQYFEYVYKQNPSAPEVIKNRLLNKLKVIKTNPFICEDDKFKNNNAGLYKAFIVYSYRVTYKIHEDKIHIIRVRHTSKEPLIY